MADHDEYDALLEEPFGEDVDWNTVAGMAGDNGAAHNAAAAAEATSTSESDEYFNDDDVFDESFLNEVYRLESQAAGNTPVVNAPPHDRNAAIVRAALTAASFRPFEPNVRNHMQNLAGSSSAANPSSDIPPRPLRRPTVVASGPQYTISTAQVNPPALDLPRSSRIPANDRAQTVLDPPSILLAKPSRITPLSKISPQPSPARKRCRSPVSHSGGESPRYKASCRQNASKVLEAIEKVLECPICYDTIAAPHLLTCGHSACGWCLCEWIRRKGDNTRCFICRAPHRGSVLPNYALDDMAATYISEKGRIAQEGLGEADGGDRKRWEKRKADGKAAVQVAAQKHFVKAPQPPVPWTIGFDPDETYGRDLYNELYDPDLYEVEDD